MCRANWVRRRRNTSHSLMYSIFLFIFRFCANIGAFSIVDCVFVHLYIKQYCGERMYFYIFVYVLWMFDCCFPVLIFRYTRYILLVCSSVCVFSFLCMYACICVYIYNVNDTLWQMAIEYLIAYVYIWLMCWRFLCSFFYIQMISRTLYLIRRYFYSAFMNIMRRNTLLFNHVYKELLTANKENKIHWYIGETYG